MFVTLFFLPFAGSYLYFIARLNQIHGEMRAQLRTLPDDRFEKLTLSRQQYEDAQVEEDEIEFNGRMYDVARIQLVGDQVVVFGLHDEAEDNLISFLHETLKNAAGDRQEVPAQVFQFMTLSFISPSLSFTNPVFKTLQRQCTAYAASDSSFVPSLDSPPPRG